MEWIFELVAGPYGGTTEGPAWDGEALLFTHIPGNRIMRFDPRSNTCTEFRTGTYSTNGLMFDAQGRLYGCQAAKYCIAPSARIGAEYNAASMGWFWIPTGTSSLVPGTANRARVP